MNEKTFQAQVVQLANLMNWRIYHTYDSRRSAFGFPDLILKSPTGKPTPEQLAWLEAFAGVNDVQSALFRPSDFGEIQKILTA